MNMKDVIADSPNLWVLEEGRSIGTSAPSYHIGEMGVPKVHSGWPPHRDAFLKT